MTAIKIKPEPNKTYRLITRSDMDGLVCAVLLKELGIIDDILFVHPKDMQDGKIDVTGNDITTNLPYVPAAFLAFDHHASEAHRNGAAANHVIDANAPSAARVVYDYFGGPDAFPNVSDELMRVVDKADSAQFTQAEILNPDRWVLLSFIMDARTGLGRFREFNVSNYQLMMMLIDSCRTQHDVSELLQLPDVRERVDLYRQHQKLAAEQIMRCGKMHSNLVILDLRHEDQIYCTNRFSIYALFPKANISCHVMWGKNKQNTVLAIGKSIFDRSSKTDVGDLMLAYGGGGHNAAGTCQIDNANVDAVLKEIAAKINLDG
jgi:nanoRNase/pAp phosphatase (c-di-AMP/oligoRNAs hydrolase)